MTKMCPFSPLRGALKFKHNSRDRLLVTLASFRYDSPLPQRDINREKPPPKGWGVGGTG